MKKLFYTLLWYIISIKMTFADWWILWDSLSEKELRSWDIHTEDIPDIIKWAIDFMMSIAWTVAIIFIIIWAYYVLFWSFDGDKSKGKNTIIMALTWFVIAALAWVIIKLLVDNLS